MLQTIVGAEIIYVTGVNLYKLSLLFFYFRVFPVRSVRLGGYACGGLSTAWNIACILAATWQCTPRERLWMPWLPGTCINLFLTQLCISVPSILCDIAILCLPLPHVLRLKTNLLQRILLMVIFLLGSYVVFTSIYRFRIYLYYTTDDIPWTLADACAWNVIEISSGIVSACLPTLVSRTHPFLLFSFISPSPVLTRPGTPGPRSLEIRLAIERRRIQERPLTAGKELGDYHHRRDKPQSHKQHQPAQFQELAVEPTGRVGRGALTVPRRPGAGTQTHGRPRPGDGTLRPDPPAAK